MLTPIALVVSLALAAQPASPGERPKPAATPAGEPAAVVLTGVAKIQAQAETLKPTVSSELAKRFLSAAKALPPVLERELYVHRETRRVYSPFALADLSDEELGKLDERSVGEEYYYNTKYGTPLAYVRVLDVLAESGAGESFQGSGGLEGKRVLDYGYGTIGHLRMMAALGADAAGVDVDPVLAALYADPMDHGPVEALDEEAEEGSLTLVHGRWPAEEDAKQQVGGGYDLITSKNTLKNGYINPEREVDKRFLVNLGVTNEEFVESLYGALKPGGVVVIYNICPPRSKPEDAQYLPWSDGRSPFSREMLEKTGFEVIAFDESDDAAMKAMAEKLGWGESMKVDELYALYTIFRRPAGETKGE